MATDVVVVGTDGSSPSQAAVGWAADDAVRRGAVLRVVHACEGMDYDLPVFSESQYGAAVSEQCRRVLADAVDLARDRVPGLEVEERLEGGPAAEVLRRASGDAAQLVLGQRGRGGFRELLLGSVPQRLAGRVAVPVVVVQGETERGSGEVAVGFDGSPPSQAALEYAFEEAARRGARVRAVHAWEAPVMGPYTMVYTPLLEEVSAGAEKTAERALAPWLERYPHVPVIRSVVCEHPVVALREASETADLLVVGSRGLGRLGSAVLGSVGHGALHHARCPVVVVPAPE
ncbi:universal stress protein [Streptosporangium sandarakinum]|uniref:Nucleotide-binding universal stress UspA family protein n=1 Tax=Streptosporangium sandarakinum TaxID=1260955 RepID=A0A852UWK8_9ACTN|nr:universal stress protein [Streptosporangium sandarakinum]NYF38015.1 nucleotide-binding universal stress UspA family protein [Streptosporangium sandarakinum]